MVIEFLNESEVKTFIFPRLYIKEEITICMAIVTESMHLDYIDK